MSEIIKNLEITSLVHGGRGIGRHEGKAVFVPLTAPGDQVSCRVVKSRRRFVEAELLEVTAPSSLRRSPPCPFFGSCGGCQWQHLTYPEQARWKEKIFSEQMLRSGTLVEEHLKPIVLSPNEWSYRNRIQLKCHLTTDGLVIGFYRHGSHSVVDVDHCRLVPPPVQHTIDVLRKELPQAPDCDCLQQIDVACGDDGEVCVVLHVQPRGRRQLRSWLKTFAASHQLNACMQFGHEGSPDLVHGDGDLYVNVDDPVMPLGYGPGGFAQINSQQNRNMVSTMLDLLTLKGAENVLDLFCGMGNFSLPVARRAGRVVGVEGHAPSIDSARRNALANNIVNAEFYAMDAATLMARYQFTDSLDLVILDPPRSGHYRAAHELLKMRPKRILYISCDPATLVRDLAPLVKDGYEVVSSQAFDLFPQTWHIESMTLLAKM